MYAFISCHTPILPLVHTFFDKTDPMFVIGSPVKTRRQEAEYICQRYRNVDKQQQHIFKSFSCNFHQVYVQCCLCICKKCVCALMLFLSFSLDVSHISDSSFECFSTNPLTGSVCACRRSPRLLANGYYVLTEDSFTTDDEGNVTLTPSHTSVSYKENLVR